MRYIGSIIISLFFTVLLQGQNTNLPLTSIGLGEIRTPTHAALMGMGGMNSSFYDANMYNIHNPASLAFLRNTSLGLAVSLDQNEYKNATLSEKQLDGGIDYIHLAFPLQNIFNESLKEEKSLLRIGAALSLQPYSRISYSIISRVEPENLPDYFSLSDGEGETYTANLSFGAGYKNFALGIDAGLFFGSRELSDRIFFDDVTINASGIDNQSGYLGFNYKIGALYQWFFNKNLKKERSSGSGKSLTIGAVFSGERKIRSNNDYFSFNFSRDRTLIDTLDFSPDVKEYFRLPMYYSVGLSYRDGDQWMIGADFEMSNWSSSDHDYLEADGLNDAYRLSVGAEFVPNRKSFNSYLAKVRYRFGAFTSRDYRNLESEEWDINGFNLGLGFPIALPRQKTTFLDLAFQWGDYDIPIENTIDNRYYRISLGLTINDNTWFFKQKYQ